MKRRLMVAASAGVLILAGAASPAFANEAALDAIDAVVHEWDDGDITAEEAMEEIDHIIHDLPSAERTGVLAEIDDLVHAWEDGSITAEAALEQIDALVHGAHHDDVHDDAHDDDTGSPPAHTGSGGLVGSGGQTTALLGLGAAGLLVALLGAGRLATARTRG